jgi:lipopolysaccharide export system permease protein
MRVLDRYIMTTLGRYIALSMAVLLVLAALFLFVNEQGWVGAGRYGQFQALGYVLAQLPATALQFLPVAALLGALLALGQLARGSELTVMRAAGIPVARIAATVAVAGLLLLPVAVAVGEWLAPQLAQIARVSRALDRNESLGVAAGSAWLRDGDLLLRADAGGGVTIFELDGERRLAAITTAGQARPLAEGGWELRDTAQTLFAVDAVNLGAGGTRRLATSAGAEILELAGKDPRQLSLTELRRAIRLFDAQGQDTRRQRFAFWSGVARLAAIPLAMLLAVPLLFSFLRNAEGGARAALGLGVGLLYFVAQRMVENGTLAFGLAPLPLAWLPTLLLGFAVALLLWRTRRISAA